MENNNNENQNQSNESKIVDTMNDVLNDLKEGTQNVAEKFNEALNDVKDESGTINSNEIKNGILMGLLAYLLPFVPFLIEKENKFVIYHAKQGMNLFILAIIIAAIKLVLGEIPGLGWLVSVTSNLCHIGLTILCIVGIIYVCTGKAKELPFINKIKFIR